MSLSIALYSTILFLNLAVSAYSQSVTIQTELGRKLDTYLSRNELFGMSAAVLVAKDGKIILEKGYGEANRTTGTRIDPESQFIIGSLSKQFTAAAILRLEADGKLSTSDAIRTFFPNAPTDKANITVHQLLTHTAGLPYLGGQSLSENISREQSIQEALATPVDTAKIGKYYYSTPGYELLGAIVEKASGESFNNYVREHLFEPAGMAHSGFAGEHERFQRLNVVHSYSNNNDEGSLADYPHMPRAIGGGTIASTIGDLYRWVLALKANKILPDSETKKLFSPYVKVNDRGQYGYGWNIFKTIRNTTLVNHAGDLGGYNSDLRMYVDEGMIVIFLSNARPDGLGYRDAVMNNISLIALGGGAAIEPPPVVSSTSADLRPFTGEYQLNDSTKLSAWLEKDKLFFGANSQEGIRLLTQDDSVNTEAAFNTATRNMLADLRQGSLILLKQNLHPSLMMDPNDDEFLQAKADTTMGKFEDVEVLGTAVLSPVMAKTFFEVRHERGSSIHSYSWIDGKIMGAEGNLLHAMPVQFARISDSELASFDPFTGRGIRLHFHKGNSELTMETGHASIRGRKAG